MNKLAIFGGNPTFNSEELKAYNPLGEEEKLAVNRVMDSGNLSGYLASWGERFLGGPEVKTFESMWSEIFECKYSIAVNSNTSGLIASVGAAGISPGDEVIVPPVTMSATVAAPLYYGGVPRFVDIEPDNYCLDYDKVKANINSKTKAIIVVNIFGQPARLHELRNLADEHGIILIEDNAQSPLGMENNKYTGTIGHIGVFSLNVHKHIHCGEGGVCTTDDSDLALKLQCIRNHAEACVQDAEIADLTNMVGMNLRMSELHAAIAKEQLKKAKDLVDDRILMADKLNKGLSGLRGIRLPLPRKNSKHAYYMWQARYISDEMDGLSRDLFCKALNAEGFPNFSGYLPPQYMLPMFQNKIAIGNEGFPFNLSKDIDYEIGLCPVAENFHLNEAVGFDICGLVANDEQIKKMIDAFHKVYENRHLLRDL